MTKSSSCCRASLQNKGLLALGASHASALIQAYAHPVLRGNNSPSPCKACKQQSTHLTPCLVGMFWLYGRTKQTGIKPLHYTHLRACLVGMTSEGCSGSGKRTRTCKKVDETVFQAVLKSKLSGSELNSFSPEADASHRGP